MIIAYQGFAVRPVPRNTTTRPKYVLLGNALSGLRGKVYAKCTHGGLKIMEVPLIIPTKKTAMFLIVLIHILKTGCAVYTIKDIDEQEPLMRPLVLLTKSVIGSANFLTIPSQCQAGGFLSIASFYMMLLVQEYTPVIGAEPMFHGIGLIPNTQTL